MALWRLARPCSSSSLLSGLRVGASLSSSVSSKGKLTATAFAAPATILAKPVKPLLTTSLLKAALPSRSFTSTAAQLSGHGHGSFMIPRDKVALTFIDPKGKRYHVTDAEVGEKLTDVAWRHNIPLYTDCGTGGGDYEEHEYGPGATCVACQVYIPMEFLSVLDPAEYQEKKHLFDGESPYAQTNSRLACQIRVKPEMQGMAIGLTPEIIPMGFFR